MIYLELLGADTRLGSTLCAACPQGPAGCCVSPPDLDWSDVGRIVSLGGRDWLLDEIAAAHLRPVTRGLAVQRVRRRASTTEPRRNKCVYHGPQGCTIAVSRRAATCNYFLCVDAYAEGREAGKNPAAATAEEAHWALQRLYARWDRDLAARVGEAYAEGIPWDAAFLDWLGAAFEAHVNSSGVELSALAPSPPADARD